MEEITWDKTARENFEAVLAKIPVFLRGIAQHKVSQKAEENARDRYAKLYEVEGPHAGPSDLFAIGPLSVSQKDVVDAFFMETPFGFHGPMKMDMEALGIDYKKYGYSK